MKKSLIIGIIAGVIIISVAFFLLLPLINITDEEEINVPNTPSNAICKQIPLSNELSPGDKYYCLAVVNKNPAFCEKIVSDIEESGNSGDNPEEFDEGQDETPKNLCLAIVNENSSYCKNMQEPSPKHVCYYQLAVISGNINICDEIDYDNHEKEECYYNFISNLHWWDKSNEITTEYCNKFPVSEQRDTCMAFKEMDVSLCKNNINCLTSFEQDMSFCQGIGSTLEYCVRDRAMTSKNLSICETLTGAKRDDCIGDFCSHIKLDTSICDKISNDMEKQTRYVEVAIYLSK